MLTNDNISDIFKLTASLMDLHGENPFKAKSYSSVVYQIDKSEVNLSEKPKNELISLGISDGMASKVIEIVQTGTFAELQQLLDKTPKGVLEMLSVKGLGGKKVKTLWDELKKYRAIKASLEGINSVSAGLVLAVAFFLFDTISLNYLNGFVMLGTFIALMSEKISPTIIIIIGLSLGYFI
ncbi:MAG: hypothetical protein EAZ27_13605 [Cytophagales bacterium]|nr:MAG: hypothetical protein EAZ27_13605 [Cytophagales bacterium]